MQVRIGSSKMRLYLAINRQRSFPLTVELFLWHCYPATASAVQTPVTLFGFRMLIRVSSFIDSICAFTLCIHIDIVLKHCTVYFSNVMSSQQIPLKRCGNLPCNLRGVGFWWGKKAIFWGLLIGNLLISQKCFGITVIAQRFLVPIKVKF